MPTHPFHQVDVFSAEPLKGNPLAVVTNADDLTTPQMAAFANWTNLSETTFLLTPTHPDADYRVRIFTPQSELPFAGHPTLGTAHVWLANGNHPKQPEIIQECAAGLIRLRRHNHRLAFAAPPAHLNPVQPATLAQIARALRIPITAIRHSQHVSQKPDWIAVMLATRDEVLAIQPDFPAMGSLELGVFAPANTDAQFEVRAFAPVDGIPEDPVTGSLNAGLAQWLIAAGMAPDQYVAAQGTALGRAGRVHIQKDGATIWVGGDVVTRVAGTLTL